MEILLWKTMASVKDRLEKLVVPAGKFRTNRRMSKYDRRRSVNDGLIVSLSTRVEKRSTLDRREKPVAQTR